MNELYILKWENLATGAIGQGSPTEKRLADAWAGQENKKHDGEIWHWVEEVEDETSSDDYDWQDDTDDRGWLTYGERTAMQSRAEM